MRTSCLSCLAKAIQALPLQALGQHTYYACTCSASTATCASVRLPSSCPPARLPPCLPTHLVQSAQAAVRNYHGPGNLNSRLHVSQFWRLRNPRLRQIHFLVRFLLPAFSQPPRCCALTWQREKFSCHFLFFEQL